MSQFKIGDVVELKSGSPTMTVCEINDRGEVTVRFWNNPKSEFNVAQFKIEAIKIFEPAKFNL